MHNVTRPLIAFLALFRIADPCRPSPAAPAVVRRQLSASSADARREAVSGVWWILARFAVIAGVSAIGTTLLVRSVGPAVWGGFAVAFGLLVSADAVLSKSVIAALLRHRVEASPRAVAAAARLAVVSGLVLAGLIAALAVGLQPAYHPDGFAAFMVATSACCVLYALRALPLTLLERNLVYRRVAVSEVADTVAFYLVALGGLAVGHPVLGIAFGTVARGLASLLTLRSPFRVPWLGKSSRPEAKALLAFGAPLIAVQALATLDGLVPLALLSGEPAELGFLLTAGAFLGYGVALSTAVQRVGMPSLSKVPSSAFAHAARRATTLSSTVALAILIPVVVSSGIWLVLLFGEAWRPGVAWAQMVGVAFAIGAPVASISAALLAQGHSRAVSWLQVVALLTYVMTALLATAFAGAYGVGIGLIVSRAVWTTCMLVVAWRILGVTPERPWFTAFGGGALVLVLGVLLVGQDSPAAIALCGALLLYGLWLWFVREVVASTVRTALGSRSR